MNRPMPKIIRRFVETERGYVHLQEVVPLTTTKKTLAMLSITSFGGVLTDLVLPQLAERS